MGPYGHWLRTPPLDISSILFPGGPQRIKMYPGLSHRENGCLIRENCRLPLELNWVHIRCLGQAKDLFAGMGDTSKLEDN